MNTESLTEFFSEATTIKPDFIFPFTMFDPVVRGENNLPVPMRSKIKPNYDMPGAYAFFEPCNQAGEIEIMYVGRSATLRNRLTGHWGNYYESKDNVVAKWHKYCWDNDLPYCPHVAVFVSYSDIRYLEHWLMQLKPRFNVH